jgi:hypothetical protein
MSKLNRLALASIGSLAIIATPTAAVSAAKSPPKHKHQKRFKLDLCKIASGAVAAAGVTAPCERIRTTTVPGRNTPIGRAPTVVTYEAQWGKPTNPAAPAPTHYALVVAAHLVGSGPTLKIAKKKYRLQVLENGAPVSIGGAATASLLTEPFACLNPPTHQCAKGTLLAIKANWVIQVYVNDFPATVPGAPELELPAAEAAVKQTEEAMKPTIVSIGTVVNGRV